MTKTVLLTGANGFVGRQVLRSLGDKGFVVRLVLREGQSLPEVNNAVIENVVYTTNMFLETADWWATTCKGVDTVIHVAWYAEPGNYLQSSKNIDCLIGTLQLAKGVLKAGVRRMVGIGTCFEYDLVDGLLSVDTPLKPVSPYAGAKAAAYMSLSQLLPSKSVEFVWCRLFYLYGEGEDARRLVPYVRERLAAGKEVELTSGNQIRDYMNVKDAGEMIVRAAISNVQGAVNVCSGESITVRDLVEKIADEYGRRDLLKFGVRADNPIDPPQVVGVVTSLDM